MKLNCVPERIEIDVTKTVVLSWEPIGDVELKQLQASDDPVEVIIVSSLLDPGINILEQVQALVEEVANIGPAASEINVVWFGDQTTIITGLACAVFERLARVEFAWSRPEGGIDAYTPTDVLLHEPAPYANA
jgi:hypothetical protein